MKVDQHIPPRVFEVGSRIQIEMHDCGRVHLDSDEQLTFTTGSGGELDVARKEWGFYATPSLNGRLADFGLRAALVRNTVTNRFYILVVERGYEGSFDAYLAQESCEVVIWLDTTESLECLRTKIA